MQKRISADEAYIKMAIAISQRSTCLDKNVGCVIVNNTNEVISCGYNGSPRGFKHCINIGFCIKDKHDDPNLCLSAHAEQNALLQCRVPEQIHTIYLTLSPCIMCMRIIMNTPCQRIVFLNEHKYDYSKNMWKGEWCHYALQ